MIDTSRHDSVFNRMEFNPRRVDVIGAGAVGSWCVLTLAQLGIENIHVWDDDVVEEHNLSNQFYFPRDVGKHKVNALAANVAEKTTIEIVPHATRIESTTPLGEIVFVCVDTMRDRKTIFETCIRNKLGIKLMVETRMGVSEYNIYQIKPTARDEIAGWEASWYSDDEVEPVSAGVCRAQVTAPPTAMMLGAHAAYQVIPWFANQPGGSTPVEHEQHATLTPWMTFANQFGIPAVRSAA